MILGVVLEASGRQEGAILDAILGHFRHPFGVWFLGRFLVVFEAVWEEPLLLNLTQLGERKAWGALLGASWGPPEAFRVLLGTSRCLLGTFWGPPGASWGHPGLAWRPHGTLLALARRSEASKGF